MTSLETAWIRLLPSRAVGSGHIEFGPFKVKVVRIRGGCRKKYRVHVAFTQAWPDEFYAAALNGPAETEATWSGDSQRIPLS